MMTNLFFQDKTSAPLVLREFLPLAHYMNGLVTAFNTLRHCCPLALLQKVLRILNSSISKVITALVDLHQLESSGFTSNEEKAYERMCHLASSAMIPYINICLGFLFPTQKISEVVGIPVADLQKRQVNQLDVESLIGPIENFLPKEEIIEEIEEKVEQLDINKEPVTEEVIEKRETLEVADPDHFSAEENQ